MAFQYVAELVLGLTVLFISVVFDCLVCDRYRYFSCCDLQLAVLCLDCELIGNDVAVHILHHSCSADGVSHFADICALGIARRKTAYCVLVVFYCELQGLDALGFLLVAVIHIAGVALGNYFDLILLFPVCDRQFTGGLCLQDVVRGDIVLTCHDLEVICVGTVVICAYQRSFRRCVGDRRFLLVHYVAECVLALAVLFISVVFDRLICDCYCYLSR